MAAGIDDWAGATFLTLGVATVFGKFAFGNYYYLISFFALLYVVGWSARENSSRFSEAGSGLRSSWAS